MNRTAEWIFARAAFLLLSFVTIVLWLSFLLSGCSVDAAGLNEPASILARGQVDTGVTEVVTPTDSADAGVVTLDADLRDTAVGPVAPPDATPEIGQVPDGGTPNTPDVGNDTGNTVPPSECPISATRSLSPCTATTQLCRYYDTGAPVLMSGCTAEGRLCVTSCN